MPLALRDAQISAVASSPVITVPLDAELSACAELMRRDGFRHLPVVDADGALAGVLHDVALLGAQTRFWPGDVQPDPDSMATPYAPVAALMLPPGLLGREDTPLLTALRELNSTTADHMLLVDDNDRPVGIFTDHDVVRIGARQLSREHPSAVHMHRRFPMVGPLQPRRHARGLMEAAQRRHLVVMANNQVVGILSRRDLLRQGWPQGAEGGDPTGQGPTVGELLGRAPLTVAVGAPMCTVAEIMAYEAVGCLPVLDGVGDVVGVLYRDDVLRALIVDLQADADGSD